MWLWIISVFVILIILIIFEYLDHDCIPTKECYHRVPSPTPSSTPEEIFNSLHTMLRSNNDFVLWRQAAIAAIGATILIAIFLFSRFPTPFELFFIGLLIFLSVYFSLAWMRTHYHSPNTIQIEKGLFLLEEKLKFSILNEESESSIRSKNT